jgi:ketosteroid isomerase-like protein
MSQENVDTVRRCYELLAGDDFARFEEVAHPDAVLDLSRNFFNPGVFEGRDAMRRFIKQADEMWDDFRVEPEEFIDAGDEVVAVVRASGKGRDGVAVSMQLFAVWALRDGKVARITGGYRDRAKALEAAGRSE